jgi:hypothetical protein
MRRYSGTKLDVGTLLHLITSMKKLYSALCILIAALYVFAVALFIPIEPFRQLYWAISNSGLGTFAYTILPTWFLLGIPAIVIVFQTLFLKKKYSRLLTISAVLGSVAWFVSLAFIVVAGNLMWICRNGC